MSELQIGEFLMDTALLSGTIYHLRSLLMWL